MPKAVRISPPVTSSEKFDNSQLGSLALFGGIGLWLSLVAMMAGVQGVWH